MRFKIAWRANKGNKKYKTTPLGGFLLIICGALIAVIFAELSVRCFVALPLEKEYLRFYCSGYEKVPPENYDRDLFWKPVEEFKNVEYSIKKPENTFRIICIGDSITQGDAQEKGLLPREQTYVYKLEQRLAEEFKGKNIEVINAASGGYSSLQGLRYLEKKLWKYEPDLVISWFGINDYFYSLFYSDKQQKIPAVNTAKAKKLLQKSKLYLFLKNFFFIRDALKNPVVRVPPDDFYDNCEQMVQIAKENDFEIVFIAPFQAVLDNNIVEYLQGYPEKLEALSRKYGTKVLYLKRYLDGHDLKKIYVDICHLNNEGNDIVAKAVFESLKGQWRKYLQRQDDL